MAGGERVLRRLGFRECRVRYHDKVARIEVPAEALAEIMSPEIRRAILDELRALGFLYITVDLQGFRSGSLNEALDQSAPHSPDVQQTTPPTAGRRAS